MFRTIRRDGKSYRTVLVEMFKDLEYGSKKTYVEIAQALELNHHYDLNKIQGSIRLANMTLLKYHKRGLHNIRGIGYRIINPNQHMLVANNHQTKAERQMNKAMRFYQGTDLSKLTEGERRLHHGQQLLCAAVYAAHTDHERRIRRIEDLLQGTTTINQEEENSNASQH